jgi:hypothetical protein
MLRNYITETYLKGLFPELTKYLWTGETTYDKQKQLAEDLVSNDFVSKGYKLRQLRPQLDLRVSGTTATVATSETATDEDIANRLRVVVNVTYISGTATVNIQGTDVDDDSRVEADWVDIPVSITFATPATAITCTAVEEITGVLKKPFKYYRCKSDGEIDYDCYLIEQIFDMFYAFKWLKLIMLNSMSMDNDQFDKKKEELDNMYSGLWASSFYYIDKDDSGDLDTSEQSQGGTVYLTR